MNLISNCKGTRRQDKRKMKPKFFSPISDRQQSVVPAPSSLAAILIPPALLVLADCMEALRVRN